MMELYYHIKTKRWYQCNKDQDFFLGRTDEKIPYQGRRDKQSLPFLLSESKHKLGPLVGILTWDSKKGAFFANVSTCKRIVAALQLEGAVGIILTPNSFFAENYVEAFTYYMPWKKWVTIRTPLPDIVYNRVPYRSMEESPEFEKLVSFLKKKGIPFFNPGFFSKWNIYEILNRNSFLSQFLPFTILCKQREDIYQMLDRFEEVYIKLTSGYKGIGIYQLKKTDGSIQVHSPESNKVYPTVDELWEDLQPQMKGHDYIIQEAIPSDTYLGERYDLRILCHFKKDRYVISGIGVRVSGNRGITTHVPNGGKIIPFEKVRARFDEDILEVMVDEIGTQLSTGIGEFIGEFSLDMGKSQDGSYYIYEINSKPMVFDEPRIKDQGLVNLSKLLIMKANDN